MFEFPADWFGKADQPNSRKRNYGTDFKACSLPVVDLMVGVPVDLPDGLAVGLAVGLGGLTVKTRRQISTILCDYFIEMIKPKFFKK